MYGGDGEAWREVARLSAWSVYPYFESGTIAVTSGAEGLFLLRYRPEEPVS